MDQEKFGQLIKDIRKKYHLTQKDLANKYNVTYQAVSKWENGLNMPDMALIKEISKDFNISIDELLNGEYKKKKDYKFIFISLFILIIVIIFLFLVLNKSDSDFNFKTLTTECEAFSISGNIAYNEKKSAIYITNIKYCGGNDIEEYKSIECILYEASNNIERKIDFYKSTKRNIKLEDFLQNLTFSIDNYDRVCSEYNEESLYLEINAQDKNDKIISYKIPLKLENC